MTLTLLELGVLMVRGCTAPFLGKVTPRAHEYEARLFCASTMP